MRTIFFTLLPVFCLLSCESDTHEGLPAPLRNELDQFENCSCNPVAKEYRWRSETVYVVGGGGPSCVWVPVFYNSAGIRFDLPEGYTFFKFYEDAKFVRTVWTCQEENDGSD